MVRVMTTPLVLKLVGAKLLPVEITTRNLSKILYGKHAGDMDLSIMKQLPRALADPGMIFTLTLDAIESSEKWLSYP